MCAYVADLAVAVCEITVVSRHCVSPPKTSPPLEIAKECRDASCTTPTNQNPSDVNSLSSMSFKATKITLGKQHFWPSFRLQEVLSGASY